MKKTGRCLRRTERREEFILRRRREREEFRPFAQQPTQNRLFRIREMHLFIDMIIMILSSRKIVGKMDFE